MSHAFFEPPSATRFALRSLHAPRALLPATLAAPTAASASASTRTAAAAPAPVIAAIDGDLAAIDLLIEDGRITAIEPAGTMPAALGPDLDGSLALPGMIDCHTHLDKGHIWPRQPNLTGDFPGAVLATTTDRAARWDADDLRARMEFGLSCAWANGVVAIRTHLDSLAPQSSISFPVFHELRERWAGRIELQVSSIAPLDIFLTEEGRVLADIVAEAGGNLGCASRFSKRANPSESPELDAAYANLFRLATERKLNVDLHVDESTELSARALIRIARIAAGSKFAQRILCGHCCSLALQTDEFIEATLDACVEAGIDIVSLPTVNMYLQDRSPRDGKARTPRWRGVTVLHEMKARGLRVAVAGDNCRDPFYAYGNHDMLDTFTQAVKILQLDHPFGDWIRAATATPAAIMGIDRGTIAVGATADLLILKARSYSEMLSRHQFDRTVLRAGKAINTRLPDYRELDGLMREQP